MEFLQRLDEQIVHREPDRPAPVRIASEQTGARFTRFIVHAVLAAARVQHVGLVLMDPGKRPDAMRRQKLLFVQHELQNLAQLIAIHNRHQPTLAGAGRIHARHVCGEVRAILDEPVHAPLEARELIDQAGLQGLHREQRNQPNHGTDLQRDVPAGRMQDVVEKAVLPSLPR